jgi:mRNA-degrading endonuclease RelE of RelBE toxin-antitoxin system
VAIRPELAPYRLELSRNARKELEQLSAENAERVAAALVALCESGTGDIKDLGEGYIGAYSLRVGSLRVYLDVVLPERTITVVGLEKRGEAYRRKSRKR